MADITITPGNVTLVSGKRYDSTAGATLTAGSPVYKDAADSNEMKASDASATGTAACDGIMLCGGGDGQPVWYAKDAGSVIGFGAVLTLGETYVVSATAGGIAPVGDLVSTNSPTILGVAITTSNLQLGVNVSGVALA